MPDNLETKNIIYDGDRFMAVEPLTRDSLKYFTNNTDWVLKLWDEKYRDGGKLILLIDKKYTPTDFYGIFIPDDYDEPNNYFSSEDEWGVHLDDLYKKIPEELMSVVEPYMYEGKIYDYLIKIKDGMQVPNYELERIDDLIDRVKYNEKKPSKTIFKFKFDGIEDYAKVLDVPEDDMWILKDLFYGYYYGPQLEIYNSDLAITDWVEGYTLAWLNQENQEKLKNILKYISPELVDWEGKEDKVSEILFNMFPREIENIIDEYQQAENECRINQLTKDIKNDICNPFVNYGLFEKECMYSYYTSLGLLLGMYKVVGDKTLSLRGMLKKLIEDQSFEGYDQWVYETWCDEEYDESVHLEVSNQLDNILEKIEDSEDFVDFEEYKKIYDYFGSDNSKYKFGKTYKTPKSMSVNFIPLKINPTNNKVVIRVYDNNGKSERELTMDEFNNFLYSGELF